MKSETDEIVRAIDNAVAGMTAGALRTLWDGDPNQQVRRCLKALDHSFRAFDGLREQEIGAQLVSLVSCPLGSFGECRGQHEARREMVGLQSGRGAECFERRLRVADQLEAPCRLEVR